MTETDHWFRFNIGDYLADTMEFTPAQHGIYILLLLHAYKHDGRLPGGRAALARIARAENSYSRRMLEPVLQCFDPLESGGYRHKRVVEELERAKVISSMGKHAASHRWPKGNGNADRYADRTPDRYANQEPEPESPPKAPPRGGARRGGSRNAFADIISETLAAKQREDEA